MSADNGIYILQSKDGFRVIHTTAIDGLWWWDDEKAKTSLNPKYLLQYFGKADVMKSEDEAWKVARDIYKGIMNSDFPVLEYGIKPIYGWEDKDFPS
jgi:hypothetical protein